MIVLCGLGNPGKEYTTTRHNLGFLLLDYLVSCFCTSSFIKKFSGEVAHGLVEGINVTFFKPMTFMNLSGKALSQLTGFYKISSEKIIVVHDDVDIEFGDVRIKKGGSSGGHNGLKSIDKFIGKDYWRIRFGVGKDERVDLSNYVLSKFSQNELEKLEIIFNFFKKNISILLSDIEENRAKFIECYKSLSNA